MRNGGKKALISASVELGESPSPTYRPVFEKKTSTQTLRQNTGENQIEIGVETTVTTVGGQV
jgi:hypothetical protein